MKKNILVLIALTVSSFTFAQPKAAFPESTGSAPKPSTQNTLEQEKMITTPTTAQLLEQANKLEQNIQSIRNDPTYAQLAQPEKDQPITLPTTPAVFNPTFTQMEQQERQYELQERQDELEESQVTTQAVNPPTNTELQNELNQTGPQLKQTIDELDKAIKENTKGL